MPGTFVKPKSFNRRYFINIGTDESPEWAELARGITSRGTSISESSQDYYDMASRGVAEVEPTGQTISRTFSGFRVIGDKAQDEVLISRLYALDKRQVEFIDYYDNVSGVNGWKGLANITISNDGGGDAQNRESVEFGLNYSGAPKRGTVTIGEDGQPVFAEAS